MKVQFVQSGGFVGAVKGCELDTASLDPDQAQELERLVRGSGIANSGESLSDTGRDLQQYEITIEDGDQRIAVTLDDETLPQSAKALVGLLKKHARARGMG